MGKNRRKNHDRLVSHMKKTTPFIFFMIMAISAFSAYAADLYLDGSATGCSNGSSNYDPSTRSCGSGSSKVFLAPLACSRAIKSYDHVYIRAGEYYQNVTSEPEFGPTYGAAGSRIIGTFTLFVSVNNATVENYNGELVWLKSGPDHVDVSSNDTNYPIIVDGSYNTVRGNNGNFRIWGMVPLGGNNNVVDGLDVSGGGIQPITSDCWGNLVFSYGDSNTLRNSRLHDNKSCSATATQNHAMIMEEGDSNLIIENNHFYNPVKGWVYNKYQRSGPTLQATFRYNFFDGANAYPWLGTSKDYGAEIRVYQNIFKNTTASGLFDPASMQPGKFIIYNNTFYNVYEALKAWTSLGAHTYFNNIIYSDSGTHYGIFYDEAGTVQSYIDYNDYYATGSGSMRWSQNYTTYSTLSSWQAATAQEAHSVNINPGFINTSGIFSQASDFRRTAYPANGRGGSYPSVMGAYVTGNEVIGVGNGSLPPPPPPPQKTPNPPTAVRVN